MSKNLTTQPKPENILAVLQQSAQPLSSKELAVQANVVRNLLNPVLAKLKDEGKIVMTGENPPKFSVAEGQSFQLSAPQAAPAAAKTAPRANVVPITPKNARPAAAERPPVEKPATVAQSASSVAEIRDSLIQIINDEPQTIASLEEAYGAELAKAVMASLHDEGLIAQEKILGQEAIILSPKGEELYQKLLDEGKISQDNPAKLPSQAAEAPATTPVAAQAAPSAKPEVIQEAAPEKRGPGRPKGATTKKTTESKSAKGAKPTKAKTKSAAPKAATAAPVPTAAPKAATQPSETPKKAAATAITPAPVDAPAPAAKAEAPAAAAPKPSTNPLKDLESQLAGLLEGAVERVAESQARKNSSHHEKNMKVADDMAAVSDLMLDLGARLKSLSESLRED